MEITEFVDLTQTLTEGCRRHLLTPPAFRARPGARSLKRCEDGAGIVTVEIAGREHDAVRDDMIRGVLAFNSELHPDLVEEYFYLLVTAVEGLPPESVPEPGHVPSW